MIDIIDSIYGYALEHNLTVKYIALSPTIMKLLITEVVNFTGKDFAVEALSMYKDIPLKVKDIVGVQVSFDIDLNTIGE